MWLSQAVMQFVKLSLCQHNILNKPHQHCHIHDDGGVELVGVLTLTAHLDNQSESLSKHCAGQLSANLGQFTIQKQKAYDFCLQL